MATIKTRIDALEAVNKAANPYAMPFMPGCKRLPILVLRGPNEVAELEYARARGFAAELDTPENNARFLG